MRPELQQFHYDWQLAVTFKNLAALLGKTTPGERDAVFSILPRRATTYALLNQIGQAMQLLVEATHQWLDDLVHAKERGKKTVLTTYCYPVGILQAFDCVPVNAEVLTAYGGLVFTRGLSDFLDYCVEIGMTETSCSGQRGSMGAYLAGLGTEPDFCLANTAGICDSNANAFHFYTAYKDIPMYMHDAPPELSGERATRYHRRDFRTMLTFLEEQTGKKVDWDRLRQVVAEIRRQDDLINEIQQLMTAAPCPVPALAMPIIYLLKFGFNGVAAATQVLEELLRVSLENYHRGVAGTASGREKARCLSSYIDHYTMDFRFFGFFNDLEVSIMGCMLNYFFPEGAPYAAGREDQCYRLDVSSEESIIDSLADQLARMPMIKQIRGPYDAPEMWLEDTLSACKLYRADCTIYLGTLGCRNTWGMVKPFMRDLEAAGYPSYALFADAFDDRVKSWEACKDAMLEFFEVREIL
ncbi:MAG: 2-hydroxyacyl-CoA dehydratase [Desulfosudaceae bacterium]